MPTPGPLELVIILVIALLILGPGKLPDVGSALGKSIREFRKASSDIGDSVKVDTSPLPPTRRTPPPAPTVPPRPRPTRPRLPRTAATSAAATRRARGLRRRPRERAKRADDRHELGPRPTRPRWPTPTPCATPRLPGVPADARTRPAARRPRPTARSCRSSTTSGSCATACSG